MRSTRGHGITARGDFRGERVAMATFTVTTTADVVNATDGKLSLREAMAQANATAAADTIVFGSAVEGRTLVLTGGELVAQHNLTLDGDANRDAIRVTIDGNFRQDFLRNDENASTLTLRGLDITHCYSPESGGALSFTGGILEIENCSFGSCVTNALAFEGGGALHVSGGAQLIIKASRFSDCSAIRGSGGAIFTEDSHVSITNTTFEGNSSDTTRTYIGTFGGAIFLNGGGLSGDRIIAGANAAYGSGAGGFLAAFGPVYLQNSSIFGNQASIGGGIELAYVDATINNTTLANNRASHWGAAIDHDGDDFYSPNHLNISNSTISNNIVDYEEWEGRGIDTVFVDLNLANNIIVANGFDGRDDLYGVHVSNGHNIFGSDVAGNIAGDVENVAASAVFANIDPDTGGGLVNADGIVPLRSSVTNPALGGADRFAIGSTDQIDTPRPSPTGTNPDAGAAENSFAHSKVSSANNDTLTGTATANTLNGLAGHDFLKGLGGNDTLNGGDGGDFLEGGTGNDKLNGGTGIDTANYGDLDTKVVVDLRGDAATDTDTAKRGTETDTLTGIEGAIGRGGADVFYGDGQANWFQGGGGKDTFTGGSGRDTYDLNSTSASAVGTARDVITDFAHLVFKIDLMGIDADTTVAGNQSFRWVGSATLTGPGEVGFYTSGGNTIVRMSTDADAASEGEIQLTGIKTLSALDFYL
jgi:hypothetical protein